MSKKFSINNMSVKAKITMFSGVMLLFMVVIAGVGIFSSNAINTQRKDRYNNYAMAQYYLSEAFSNFGNIKTRIRNMPIMYYAPGVDIEFADQVTKINNYEKAMYENLALFEASLSAYNSKEINDSYNLVKQKLEAWMANTRDDIELIQQGKSSKDSKDYDLSKVEAACNDLMLNGRAIADEAEAAVDTLVSQVQKLSDENGKQVERELVILETILIVVAVLAFVITFAYAAVLIRAITVPVEKLTNAAKKLAIGDIEVDCQKVHDDDLGDLMDDFAEMVKAIRHQAEIANTIASGDLTIAAKARSDKDLLGIAMNKLVVDNNRTLSNVNEATMQVTVGSEQVATASQALAQGATEQASALEEVTASMNEIAERTKKNAVEANQANELAHEAKDMAFAGNNQMKELIDAMNDINEASEAINKIIKMIDDISFQTNILALNAAVEAARAGVHGKGFAVVAEEVRNLAAKSASAAKETQEKIEDSIHKVGNGMKLAEDTAKALDEIVSSIDKVGDLIGTIATSSSDQATAVSQIDQAISQVSQVVQTNSATSEECAAASEELSNQAATLRSLMANFKLSGTGTSTGGGFTASRSSSSSYNANEQIISLGGEFGKY